MTSKCPKCGSEHIYVTCWDGARSGGMRVTCACCNYVIEESKYSEHDASEYKVGNWETK